MLVFINCPPPPGSHVFGWMMLNWHTSLIPSWWPAIEPMEFLKEDQITKSLSDVCPLQKFLLLKMPQIWAVEGCLRSCLVILIWKLKVDYIPEKFGHLSLELTSTVTWISPFPLSFRPFTYLLVLLSHQSLWQASRRISKIYHCKAFCSPACIFCPFLVCHPSLRCSERKAKS